MQKFGVTTLFLMSVLLVGSVTPVTNGFQIVGFAPYFGAAFGQTNQTDNVGNQTATDDDSVLSTTINKLEVKADVGEGVTEVEVELEFVTPNMDLDEISQQTVTLFSMDRETIDDELIITFSDNETGTESGAIIDEEIKIHVDGDEDSAEVEVELKFTIESTDPETIKDAIIQETQLDLTMVTGLVALEFPASDETPDEVEDEIIDESEIQNLGQMVADFVHDARDQFRSQKEETKAIIDACREAIRNASPEERQNIRVQCREDLNDVRESYQELRRTYHEVFREFRDNIRILVQEARGVSVSDSDAAAAIAEINRRAQRDEFRDRMQEIRMEIKKELREEIKELREQMKEEREQMREEMQRIREASEDKDLREEIKTLREEMKQERDKLKEQIQEERDRLKEQMKEEREKMKEQMKETREQMKKERGAIGDEVDLEEEDEDDLEDDEELEEETEEEEIEEETQG